MKKCILVLMLLSLKAFSFDNKLDGFVVGGAGGFQLYGYNEVDDFGVERIEGDGVGFNPLLNLFLGLGKEDAIYFAEYSVSSFEVEKLSESGIEVKKNMSSISAGVKVFPARTNENFNGLYLGTKLGILFHIEEDVYQGRGMVLGVGTGYEFKKYFSSEINLLRGKTSETKRSFDYYSLQLLFVITGY